MENKVLEALSKGKALKAGEVAEATGVAKEEVSKIIKKLVKDGKVHSPAMCKYEALK